MTDIPGCLQPCIVLLRPSSEAIAPELCSPIRPLAAGARRSTGDVLPDVPLHVLDNTAYCDASSRPAYRFTSSTTLRTASRPRILDNTATVAAPCTCSWARSRSCVAPPFGKSAKPGATGVLFPSPPPACLQSPTRICYSIYIGIETLMVGGLRIRLVVLCRLRSKLA